MLGPQAEASTQLVVEQLGRVFSEVRSHAGACLARQRGGRSHLLYQAHAVTQLACWWCTGQVAQHLQAHTQTALQASLSLL